MLVINRQRKALNDKSLSSVEKQVFLVSTSLCKNDTFVEIIPISVFKKYLNVDVTPCLMKLQALDYIVYYQDSTIMIKYSYELSVSRTKIIKDMDFVKNNCPSAYNDFVDHYLLQNYINDVSTDPDTNVLFEPQFDKPKIATPQLSLDSLNNNNIYNNLNNNITNKLVSDTNKNPILKESKKLKEKSPLWDIIDFYKKMYQETFGIEPVIHYNDKIIVFQMLKSIVQKGTSIEDICDIIKIAFTTNTNFYLSARQNIKVILSKKVFAGLMITLNRTKQAEKSKQDYYDSFR